MKRTGSIGSRVPPAVTRILTPARSCGSASPRSSRSSAKVVISSGSGSRPGPVSAPVSRPDAGSSTTAPRLRNVATFSHGGRMQPHLGVHGGREQHRTARGQQGGGQQIIGAAGDGAGQHIGGGRRHDHQVSLLADAHMRHLVDVVENPGVHRETRQCLEGGGADESQRGLGGDHPHLVAGLGELANHRTRLVGGDTARDADDDPLAGHTRAPDYSPSVCSSRSPWISRMAIDSGFSCRPGSTSGPTYSRMPSPSWL